MVFFCITKQVAKDYYIIDLNILYGGKGHHLMLQNTFAFCLKLNYLSSPRLNFFVSKYDKSLSNILPVIAHNKNMIKLESARDTANCSHRKENT